MFDSTVLDVGIGLAFVYLLLSLVCTSFSEFISQVFAMRAATLEKWLKQVLGGKAATNFYNHDLIKALYRVRPADQPSPPEAEADLARSGWTKTKDWFNGLFGGLVGRVLRAGRLPSYIPARTFATAALKDIFDANGAVDETNFNNAPEYVQTAIASAGREVGRARKALELSYDDAMERVGGWYKRNVQFIVAVIAIGVAFGMNVDTLEIGKTLWRDDSVRAAVVAAAERRIEEATPQSEEAVGETSDLADVTEEATPTPGGAAESTPTPEPPSEPTTAAGGTDDDSDSEDAEAIMESKEVKAELDALNLPIGWDGWPSGWGWAAKLAGLLMTALALSLGAPFWFDALSKLVNIRGVGKKPATTA